MDESRLIDMFVGVGHGGVLRAVDTPTPVSESAWLLRSYHAEVICHFPAETTLQQLGALAEFCSPAGLHPSRISRPPKYACFALTDELGRYKYGHCLTVDVPLPASTPVQLDSDSAGESKFTVESLGGGAQLFVPRCLCLLSCSHFPLAFKVSCLNTHTLRLSLPQPVLPPLACWQTEKPISRSC